MDQSFQALLFAIGLMGAVGFGLIGYAEWLERRWRADSQRRMSAVQNPAE